jgi:predicted PurR-regulated permease PerM
MQDRLTALDTILLIGGLLMFLVLIYEMHTYPLVGGFLNPPLIAAAGTILLWPLRRQRAAQAVLLAGGFLLGLWLVDKLSGVLIPFLLVYLLAFMFDPLVTALKVQRNVPRWVSSFVITVALVGLMALFVLLLVPNIIAQVETLATRLIGFIGGVRDWLLNTNALDALERDFRLDKERLVAQLTASLETQMTELANRIPTAAQEAIGYIGSLLGLITSIMIIPVILYYTLKDYPWIKRRLVELFPTFGGDRAYLVAAGGIVGNYLRGQLTISAIAAFNVSVALILFNIPFALLIGLMAGVLNMIPSIGVIVTNVIAILLTVMFADPWFVKAVIVFGVLLGQSVLEQAILTPKILSSHVGLHPVLIILSLLVFGYFMGIFGFLIAVPATALIMAVYKTYRHDLSFELAAARQPGFPKRFFRRRTRSRVGMEPVSPEPQPPPDEADGR